MISTKVSLGFIAFITSLNSFALSQNIIRVNAPVSIAVTPQQEIERPIVSPVNLPLQIFAINNNYPSTFEIPVTFTASNYDRVFLNTSDGGRYDVSGKSSHKVNYGRPTKGIRFWLEATKGDQTITSPELSTSAVQWCAYSYGNFYWRTISYNNIRIIDKYENVSALTSTPGNIIVNANGWNYSYYSPEALAYNNDGYYAVCKSESPINNQAIGNFLAECPDYNSSNNSWIDNGGSQVLRWTNGVDNFSITTAQARTYYDKGGYRYYPDPYDTGDKYYPICRNKL